MPIAWRALRSSRLPSAVSSRPATNTRPASGRSSKWTRRSSVDLPAPLLPMSPKTSPSRTCNETDRTASKRPPSGIANDLATPSRRISGGGNPTSRGVMLLMANEVLGERAPRRPRDRRTAHAHALRERTRKAERGSDRRWAGVSGACGAAVAQSVARTSRAHSQARRPREAVGVGQRRTARAMSSKGPEDRSERSEREVFHFGAPMSCIALVHIKIWGNDAHERDAQHVAGGIAL